MWQNIARAGGGDKGGREEGVQLVEREEQVLLSNLQQGWGREMAE